MQNWACCFDDQPNNARPVLITIVYKYSDRPSTPIVGCYYKEPDDYGRHDWIFLEHINDVSKCMSVEDMKKFGLCYYWQELPDNSFLRYPLD